MYYIFYFIYNWQPTPIAQGFWPVSSRPPQESLIREQTQQHDETYYLWSLSFFMAFNRGNGFRADLVSETISVRAFHFIERNITNYYEMLLTDRKEATSWSRR